jgi:hypothetical protein
MMKKVKEKGIGKEKKNTDPAKGKYKSLDLVAPSQATIDALTSYFLEKGITQNKIELNPSKDFVNVAMTVEQAESIFLVSKRVGEEKGKRE